MAPTVSTGHEDSYTGAVTVVRQLDAALDMYSPKDFPFLQRVGLNSFPGTIENTKIEWQQDELLPITDVLGAAITSTTATQITATYAEYFALHDLIRLDDELMRVLSIDATNNYLTVERGFAGSTAATHLISITIYRLGSARPEGSSPGWSQQVAVTQPYNYSQIWDAMVSITGTEAALKNYAPDDLLAYRLDKRMSELYMMMERALWYNNFRYVGTATAPRVTAGADFWVADKNNIASAAVTFDDIEDAMSDVMARAGVVNAPNSLWTNAWGKRKISSWGVNSIRTERTENTVGNEITVIETNFGTLEVVLDVLVKESEMWLLNPSKIMIGPMNGRGFKEIDASVAGDDLTKHRILGEYAFVFKGEDGSNAGLNVKLYGISTTL